MTPTRRFALVTVLLCATHSNGFSESKPLELRWNELGSMLVGHRVELMLTDGGRIKGEAVAIRDEGLVMDVKKASGGKAQADASGAIPRGSIGLIKLQRSRGSWGRSMGTILGVLSGLVVGGYAAAHTDSAGAGIPLFLGVASGISIGGYYAGRELDRRTTLIKIVP